MSVRALASSPRPNSIVEQIKDSYLEGKRGQQDSVIAYQTYIESIDPEPENDYRKWRDRINAKVEAFRIELSLIERRRVETGSNEIIKRISHTPIANPREGLTAWAESRARELSGRRITKEITYDCEFCHRTIGSELQAVQHEESCSVNPKNQRETTKNDFFSGVKALFQKRETSKSFVSTSATGLLHCSKCGVWFASSETHAHKEVMAN